MRAFRSIAFSFRKLTAGLGLVLVGFLGAAVARAQSYVFQDINFPGALANSTQVTGISGATIVGISQDATGFLYNGGNYTLLDDPLANQQDLEGSIAYGVDGATIVGRYHDTNGAVVAFIFNGTGYANFSLNKPRTVTTLSGISGRNLIGTYYDTLRKQTHGFFYNGATRRTIMVDYPHGNLTLGTFPLGIQGTTVVGHYYLPSGNSAPGFTETSHGFIFNGSKYTTLDDPNAGPLGTVATGIWNGTVVGYYFVSIFDVRGFLYDGASFTDFVVPNATATFVTGINHTSIVGFYSDSPIVQGFQGFLATPAPIPAGINASPANTTIFATANATFSIKYTGLPIPAVTWQMSADGGTTWSTITGGNYSGFTTATLSVVKSDLSLNGNQYRALVANTGGMAVSHAATLTVQPLVGITFGNLSTSLDSTQKFSGLTYVLLAQPVILYANITGPGSLSYQWVLNGNPITGITSANYSINKFTTPGNYSVVVHSTLLSSNTTSGNLHLALASTPRFDPPPKSVVAAPGANVTLFVGILATPPLTSLVWQSSSDSLSWSNLTSSPTYSGVMATNLTISNVTDALSGTEYRVQAVNYFGSATSSLAILTVPPPPLPAALEGKYKITSLAASFPVIGNLSVPLSSAAKAYTVTLNEQGLAALSSTAHSSLLRFANLSTLPAVTLNYAKSTPTLYEGVVSGTAAYKAPAPTGVIKVAGVSGTVVGTLVSPGLITLTYTLDGTITVKGTPHPASSGTVTVVLTKSP